MLDPRWYIKLHLNQSPIPRNAALVLQSCLVAAVAHPASRCLLDCLLDALLLLCTDSPRDRLSDSSDPKGRLLYIFSSLLFKGEELLVLFFFKPKPFLVVFVTVFKMGSYFMTSCLYPAKSCVS